MIDVFNNVFIILTPVFLISIDVFPAFIDPMIISNLFKSCLGLLKNP